MKTLPTPKIPAPGGWYGYGFGIRAGGTFWHNGGSPGVGAELDVDRAALEPRLPEDPAGRRLVLNAFRIP